MVTKLCSYAMVFNFYFSLNIEKVLLSCWITVQTSWLSMMNKKRRLVITTEQIFFVDPKSNEVKKKFKYKDLEGITKSLLQASQNFIMHIKKQETFEVISESREEIMELLYQVFYLKFCKPTKKGKDVKKEELKSRLKIYGISQKYLQDYVTSEKDVLRSINRMPNDDYLLDVLSEDDPL